MVIYAVSDKIISIGGDLMNSISEIKAALDSVSIQEIPQMLSALKADERSGVRRLAECYEKRYQAYIDEIKRLKTLSMYENSCYADGMRYIAGIDEVGRGPLAGPVVTAAVILPRECLIYGVNDSKKLSPKKREELYEVIKEKAIAISIGVETNEVIDDINILQATYRAMRTSVEGLEVKPDMLLVDAVTIPCVDTPQTAIVKGDTKSISIAAASIIAKVTRDRMMKEYSREYPGYDFENNMGYGTAKHIQGIKKYGLCKIHRRSFTRGYASE